MLKSISLNSLVWGGDFKIAEQIIFHENEFILT